MPANAAIPSAFRARTTCSDRSCWTRVGTTAGEITGLSAGVPTFPSVTTTPAARFAGTRRTGQIRAGYDADLTVLYADPSTDVLSFARVRYTIAGGRFTYGR